MTMRDEQKSAFLEDIGWARASQAPLAGDASARRYMRLEGHSGRAVLMDAPPDSGENIQPFVKMTRWLREHGLSAPDIIGDDPLLGFLLLEDLGDDLYARVVVAQPATETDLYARATDLLVHLGELAPAAGLQPYDHSVLRREAELFTEWWLPDVTAPGASWQAEDFVALMDSAVVPVRDARAVTVLRDYHAENLIWLPDRPELAAVGLLDYQDALAGHPAYDLMSLLEDARRDTTPELREAMIARYIAARPSLDAETFRRDYAILAAQRNLKIIGIFARLARRDGKLRYLELIPRVWGHLLRDLAHPDLAELNRWVRNYAPEPTRDVLARAAT